MLVGNWKLLISCTERPRVTAEHQCALNKRLRGREGAVLQLIEALHRKIGGSGSLEIFS